LIMSLLDLLFPKTCLECKKDGGYVCKDCVSKVSLLTSVCPYCEKASIDGFTHAKCKKKYGLDGITSIWKYEGVVKKAVSTLKYKYATEIVREICGYLESELKKQSVLTGWHPVTLLPVPMFWYRENFRGFNQSAEIGKVIAHDMGWGFESNLLVRTKSVKPQAGLTVGERKKNLRGVFSLDSNYLASSPSSLMLFDDVFTTGSTLHEACKVLKKAGVEKVWGITIAR
jgi:competence protein ComFC